MTLVFILITVTVMLMMIQKLIARIQPGSEMSAAPDIGGPDGTLDPAKLQAIMQLLISVVGIAGGGYIVLYGDYPVEVRYWASRPREIGCRVLAQIGALRGPFGDSPKG